MYILKSLSREKFQERFGTKDQCLMFLSNEKWKDGYCCIKCKNTKYIKGKKAYNRRCSKCGFDESPASHTLFHKLKFGIDKAFEMAYDISTSKKGANSIWLAERYSVRQTTAWLFRRKVQQAMKSSEKYPLEGEVHVDEFEIGTPQKGEQGRSKSEKKIRIVIAIENRNGKPGRAYAQTMENYSASSLSGIFEKHISAEAQIVTDKWTGYGPLKQKFTNLTQRLSNNGQNFKMLHIQIRNFKNWLRGVHSFCSKETVNQYINEYFFRFNRLSFRDTILEKLLCRMIKEDPITYNSIKCNVT
ncbi:IS1595 family transposase [Flavobacteriales bacterium]|nr:IS1595 family transposase [Flavobacteriales bacterium]